MAVVPSAPRDCPGPNPVFDVERERARRRDDGLDRYVDLDRVHDLACNLANDLADDVAYGLLAARARTMDRARLLGKALTYRGGAEEQNQRLDLLIRLLREQANPAARRLGATRPAWWLTAAAIRILPDAHRHRYAQEFTAELADLAHLPRYRQVAYAIRLARRMVILRRALGEPLRYGAGDKQMVAAAAKVLGAAGFGIILAVSNWPALAASVLLIVFAVWVLRDDARTKRLVSVIDAIRRRDTVPAGQSHLSPGAAWPHGACIGPARPFAQSSTATRELAAGTANSVGHPQTAEAEPVGLGYTIVPVACAFL